MDHKILEAIRQHKIQQASAGSGHPKTKTRAQEKTSSFEEILGKAVVKAESLKGKAKSLNKPEDLQNAIHEAGQNFKSAMDVGQDLIKAYKEALESIKIR